MKLLKTFPTSNVRPDPKRREEALPFPSLFATSCHWADPWLIAAGTRTGSRHTGLGAPTDDALLVTRCGPHVLLAIADGAGDSRATRAAEAAQRAVAVAAAEASRTWSVYRNEPVQLLMEALAAAHVDLVGRADAEGLDPAVFATTLMVVLLAGDRMTAARIGDGSLYTWDGAKLTRFCPAPKPDLKDPYWEERGRDFLWTFALAIALTAPPKERTLERLAGYLSLPLSFDDLSSKAYKNSETAKAITMLRALATRTGIADLANNATAMETALTTESNRMESVFDTARRYVATFARAAQVRRAMAHSDWNPLDLRKYPGTTVYFCLKPGELRAFAPLVRIVFQQHAAALTKDFAAKPGALPVTFFLDEMPQLGNLAAINDILDVGRGAGLRLWMFAQYLGQIRDIYGKRADGLINACQVRSFLQPDNDAAEFIAPALGKIRSLFRGDDRPLAAPHDLMGRAYANRIVTLARGEHPTVLGKLLAHQHYGRLMRLKPPVVAKSGTGP